MALLAAPNEPLAEHVNRALSEWAQVRDRLLPTLDRLAGAPAESAVEAMLRCHDLGKLTRRWQDCLREGKASPGHAAVGAGVFWYSNEADEDLRNAAAFAIAIHHVDRGLVGSNIDAPGAQAVRDGLCDEEGRLRWHAEAATAVAEVGANADSLATVTADRLEAMARALRVWSRGGAILQMHRNRLLATALHHVLRVCDVRAACQRPATPGEDWQPLRAEQSKGRAFVERLCKGGLL